MNTFPFTFSISLMISHRGDGQALVNEAIQRRARQAEENVRLFSKEQLVKASKKDIKLD